MDPHEVEITCQLALNYALSRQVTMVIISRFSPFLLLFVISRPKFNPMIDSEDVFWSLLFDGLHIICD